VGLVRGFDGCHRCRVAGCLTADDSCNGSLVGRCLSIAEWQGEKLEDGHWVLHTADPGRGPGEHESTHALRMLVGELLGDGSAQRIAEDIDVGVTEFVQQLIDDLGKIPHV
jgi:hypothetical protein